MSQEFAHSAVTNEARMGTSSMLVVLLGFTFFSASMWTGGAMALGLSFGAFLGASLLGSLILGVYAGLIAYMGTKTGLSTHLLSHYSFGRRGSALVSFLLALTQTGWFGVGIAIFAQGIHQATGIPTQVLVLIGGGIMTASAFLGMRMLTVVSFLGVPAIFLLGLFSIVKIYTSTGSLPWGWIAPTHTSLSFGIAVGMAVSSFISGGTIVADYTRFAKSSKGAVILSMMAFFLGCLIMFFFGAMGARAYHTADISNALIHQGLVGAGLLVLGLNIWTTNDNALYSAGLGMANITKISKRFWVVVCGGLGTFFALPIYAHLVSWLTFLSSFLPPLGGVLIAHYALTSRQLYRQPLSECPPVVWSSIIAWSMGVGASFLGGTLPLLNGLFVSAGVVLLFHLFSASPSPNIPLTESLYVD